MTRNSRTDIHLLVSRRPAKRASAVNITLRIIRYGPVVSSPEPALSVDHGLFLGAPRFQDDDLRTTCRERGRRAAWAAAFARLRPARTAKGCRRFRGSSAHAG